jgi:hypothetical protein
MLIWQSYHRVMPPGEAPDVDIFGVELVAPWPGRGNLLGIVDMAGC